VTAGETTSAIDSGLTVGGTITGTVTDATTGSLLSAVSVSVYDAGNNQVGYGMRNIVAGDLWIWLMDGPAKASEAHLGLVAGAGYEIVK
jgi:hypothetical protein